MARVQSCFFLALFLVHGPSQASAFLSAQKRGMSRVLRWQPVIVLRGMESDSSVNDGVKAIEVKDVQINANSTPSFAVGQQAEEENTIITGGMVAAASGDGSSSEKVIESRKKLDAWETMKMAAGTTFKKTIISTGLYTLAAFATTYWLGITFAFNFAWTPGLLDLITFIVLVPVGFVAGLFDSAKAILVDEGVVSGLISNAVGILVKEDQDVKLGGDAKKTLSKLRETIAGEVFEGRGPLGATGRLLIAMFSPFWDGTINRMAEEMARLEQDNRAAAEGKNGSGNLLVQQFFTGISGNGKNEKKQNGSSKLTDQRLEVLGEAKEIRAKLEENQRLSKLMSIAANSALRALFEDTAFAIVSTTLSLLVFGEGAIILFDQFKSTGL